MARSLHVVLIAPPFGAVPPTGYGGAELVVDLLAKGLATAGHRVTVLGANGDPLVGASYADSHGLLRSICAVRSRASDISSRLKGISTADVIHDHAGAYALLLKELASGPPVLVTIHGLAEYVTRYGETTRFASVSHRQRELAPHLPWLGTVHHGVDAVLVKSPPATCHVKGEGYLLCLARISPDKGQHLAIQVARRCGKRLVMAGPRALTVRDARYYDECVRPFIDGDLIQEYGPVGRSAKAALLDGADALLWPIQWEEPFGLALVEAMARGVPVVAMRLGSVPELVEDGVTGFVVDSVDEMTRSVAMVATIDRSRCAEIARGRFAAEKMTEGYVTLYHALCEER